MYKTISSILLAGLLTICVPMNISTTKAAEPDTNVNEEIIDETSGLLFQYEISVYSGNKKVNINGITKSVNQMKSIGFKDLCIQRSSNGTSWTTEIDLGDLLESNSYGYYLNGYSVPVTGGYYYRVTCTHYAKESGWFGDSQSVDNTSNSVWIS